VGTPLISIEVGEGSGNVLVGYGTNEEAAPRRSRTAPAERVPAPLQSAQPAASPLVRRLAAERGIDLGTVHGSGPGGMVTRADLDSVAASPAATETTRRKLVGADRVAAERLQRSHRDIPTATATTTADATHLLEQRERIAAGSDTRVTPFAVLLHACVATLSAFPRMNAHFDTEANELVLHDAVHLGVAVQTERGLVVPVIRDAQSKSVVQLAAELERLAGASRSGAITASELSGSTFTVSNFGAFGVDGGTALINPPEVGILGVGRIRERAWVVDGSLQPRSTVELSLVFDHRAADGAVAGGFLHHLADLIEQPGALHDD